MTPGRSPALLWLCGFASDMTGTKAEALAAFARARGQACVRFDYAGCGASDGAFAEGTVGRWIDDALRVLDLLVEGPAVPVGSSMGAWIACHLARLRPDRVVGLLLLAPALDFTERLLRPSLPPEALEALARAGLWVRPSAYDPRGLTITRALLEDGARRLLLPGPLPVAGPVRILQGQADPDVPWTHALETAAALASDDLVLTLVRDGDHRLSRPADIRRLLAFAAEFCEP